MFGAHEEVLVGGHGEPQPMTIDNIIIYPVARQL